MGEVSGERVLNEIPNTKHQTVVKQGALLHGALDLEEDASKFHSCLAEGDSCVSESNVALRNAYYILRDRYNKLKLEHQKLQKNLHKITEPITKKKTQKSNSKAEFNDSLNELTRSCDSKTVEHSGIHISDEESLSAGALISELEQLRDRLDRMSREAQSYVDTDLKDMMENVIPKLKELERQCSSMSEDGPRSLILLLSKDTQVKSVIDEKCMSQKTDDEIPGKQESIFHTPNHSLPESQPTSSDLSNASLCQNSVDLVRDLLSFSSSQSDDLKHIYEMLRKQNESLKKMDNKLAKTPIIPESGIGNWHSESDWSMIARPVL